MVRISRSLQKRLAMLIFDFLISAGALILTSKLQSRRKWRSIKGDRSNTGRYANPKYVYK